MAVSAQDGMKFYLAWQNQRGEVEAAAKDVGTAIGYLESAKGEADTYNNDAAGSVSTGCETAIGTLEGYKASMEAAIGIVDEEAAEAKRRYEDWIAEVARQAKAALSKKGTGASPSTGTGKGFFTTYTRTEK